jgi:hypothetical protein
VGRDAKVLDSNFRKDPLSFSLCGHSTNRDAFDARLTSAASILLNQATCGVSDTRGHMLLAGANTQQETSDSPSDVLKEKLVEDLTSMLYHLLHQHLYYMRRHLV